MSARNSVRDILYRAGAEGHLPGVERAFSSPAQGISVILKQLEHGVLARRYCLDFDSGAIAVVVIGGGRRRRLGALSPGESSAGPMSACWNARS
jgi:hypothetical protein